MLEAYKSGLIGDRYLTMLEMRGKLGGRSRSAIYLDIAAGRLPKPVKLGGKLYWNERVLDEHLRELSKGTP